MESSKSIINLWNSVSAKPNHKIFKKYSKKSLKIWKSQNVTGYTLS